MVAADVQPAPALAPGASVCASPAVGLERRTSMMDRWGDGLDTK